VRRAHAASERIRSLQAFRFSDDGVSALHLLVLEEGRLAHATNGAFAQAFEGRGRQRIAEEICSHRAVQPLLFAP
jgi:hypothetical protein